MKNDAIIASIIILIKEYKALLSLSTSNNRDIRSLRYLLNQSIREYDIPLSNWHISQEALKLWKELTTADIKNYHYRDVVVCDNLSQPCSIGMFKGANKEGEERELFPHDSFLFNELFHEDHVIPVSMILEEIVKLKTINKKTIIGKLNMMHICIILKEEDRKIGRTGNRSINFNQVIKDVYNKKDIKLANYKF
jgi:hypothetical protein